MKNIIALVNRSKRVTEEQAIAMAEALQTQANEHFAPVWGTDQVTVQAFKSVKAAPKNAHQIVLLDDHGDESSDGYHTTTDSGEPYSKVLVAECLAQGGGILVKGDVDGEDADDSEEEDGDDDSEEDADDSEEEDGDDDSDEEDGDDDSAEDADDSEEISPDTISATASHELLEMLADPDCGLYKKGPPVKKKYDKYSVEVCDPVQETAYNITLADGETVVTVSNFVTKSWFENGGAAPYDYLELLEKPFTLAGGGYMSLEDEHGHTHDESDDDDPPAAWRQAARKHPASRGNRRKGG